MKPEQNDRHLANDILNSFFIFVIIVCIIINISRTCVPQDLIDKQSSLSIVISDPYVY